MALKFGCLSHLETELLFTPTALASSPTPIVGSSAENLGCALLGLWPSGMLGLWVFQIEQFSNKVHKRFPGRILHALL